VKKKIHETAEACDAVVLLGDNFNQRHNHSSVIKEFVEFLNGFGDKEINILVGNHERFGTATALDFLKEMKKPNWIVHNKPSYIEIAGVDAVMVPYMTPALMGVETREEAINEICSLFPIGDFDLLFAHHAITGSKLRELPVEMLNEIVLPGDIVSKNFNHTFAGHIHEPQNMGNIQMTGNIFTQEMGEHEKFIYTYDTLSHSVEEVKLPVRGIYKIIWEELKNTDDIPKDSIVKCYVTNRDTDLEVVRAMMTTFDASIIIEQYPSERAKIHFEDGGLDLSVESLLRLYSEAKGLPYEEIKDGYELIK
jgi:DNA repair exonuclease SbcCD nuclease subunit